MSKNLMIGNIIINSLKEYNVEQLRIFYGMLYLYKEEVRFKQADLLEDFHIDYETVKNMAAKYRISFNNVFDIVDNMPSKVKCINKEGTKVGYIGVFEYFYYDFEESEYIIKFTNEIEPHLFELAGNYSTLDLNQLENLRGKYSQRMYELYCAYKKQNNYLMKIEVFKRYFQVPTSYKMCDINKNILNLAIEEVNKIIDGKIKIGKRKYGRNITHIMFNFNEEE